MASEIHRGELWWADVPGDTRRPVLVLTRERFIRRLHSLIAAPATPTVRGIPTEVELGLHDGVDRPCAVNFDNVFTLQRGHFTELIAALDESEMSEACAAQRFAIDC